MKSRLAAVLVFLLCFWAANAQATPGGEYTAQTGTVNTSPGVLTPQANTDLFSGSFTTSVDIATPPGRRNIQPDLKLAYNSRGGSSWVGLGWNLALASITRSLEHGTPAYGSTARVPDKFLFSGQEMVSMGNSVYRLEKESSFMKYEKNTSDNRWIATDLNGTKYYFGNLSSTLFDGSTPSALVGNTASPNFNQTFQWYLVGVRDVFGNYMIVRYQKPSDTYGYYYPASIKYTGFDPGEQGQTIQPYYEVVFTLESRNDFTPVYTAGFLMQIKHRLQKVDIKAGNTIIRTYTLSYEYSQDSGHSLLTQVQVQARNPDETALPPTQFTYYHNSTSEKGFQIKDYHWDMPDYIGSFSADYGTRLADINGDGLVDVVRIVLDKPSDTIYYAVYQNTGMLNGDTFLGKETEIGRLRSQA